ncbi:MAG: HAD family hydrolase [Muribaculaceae bacterium]|nr:HAD family hydrolase [Muribaculaceae bacterium]
MAADFNYHGDVMVFDLDDTLFRERDYCRSGFRVIERRLLSEVGESFARIAATMDRILTARGNYFDMLQQRLEAIGRADMMPSLVGDYRSHIAENLQMAEGVAPLLDALASRGVVMAIVTDGRSATQRAKIKSLGLDRYVHPDNIVISEESGSDKSVADNFSRIVDRYPEARRFYYVADNERKDFMMPNLLGWITCRVAYDDDNVHPDFQAEDPLCAPSLRLQSIASLLDLI